MNPKRVQEDYMDPLSEVVEGLMHADEWGRDKMLDYTATEELARRILADENILRQTLTITQSFTPAPVPEGPKRFKRIRA